MISVLHVIGAQLDEAAAWALRCLLRRADERVGHVVAVVDNRTAQMVRARLNPSCPVVILNGLTHAWSWRMPVPALLNPGLVRQLDRFSARVIHVWNTDELALPAIAECAPCLLTLLSPADDVIARRLRATMRRNVFVQTGTQSARRALAERGVDPRRVAVVRGPIDFRAINEARSAGMRDRLIAREDGPVILTSGPATRDGGQLNAAWAVAMLRQIHDRIRLIVPFGGPERERIRRFLMAQGLGSVLLSPPTDWSWPQLVATADVMVEPAERACASEPLAWAMAGGVPIVGTAIRSVAELIASGHNGLLCRDARPRAIASAIQRLLDDPDLRRNVADTARGQAYEVFSVRTFGDNMRRVYENLVAGRTIDDGVRDAAMA